MHSEGIPEFVVEQGLYYPTIPNYGMESPSGWDDQNRIFGFDGQDVQYPGALTKSFPYVYYTPSYEYPQSLYNPYNPCIPDPVIGVDGQLLGTQQYYTIPSYENSFYSPPYPSLVLQSAPDTNEFEGTPASTSREDDSLVSKHKRSSTSANIPPSIASKSMVARSPGDPASQVNTSGQFCGVAEMTGPVNFHKDMDFWQQDKWSGCFPVKWQIIKDVPNPNFRCIILENNEHKPVTSSRDTQEILYKKGMDMLKIFKNYTLKTSLLDDFMYYENRQKIMQDEKARLLPKNYGNQLLVPKIDPPRKKNIVLNLPYTEYNKSSGNGNIDFSQNKVEHTKQVFLDTESKLEPTEKISLDIDSTDPNSNDEKDGQILKICSICINPKWVELKLLKGANGTAKVTTVLDSQPANIVTVGSMPVKVYG